MVAHVEKDEEAQGQDAPQQGEPRQEAQLRPRLTVRTRP
jgi:hypothetical protein